MLAMTQLVGSWLWGFSVNFRFSKSYQNKTKDCRYVLFRKDNCGDIKRPKCPFVTVILLNNFINPLLKLFITYFLKCMVCERAQRAVGWGVDIEHLACGKSYIRVLSPNTFHRYYLPCTVRDHDIILSVGSPYGYQSSIRGSPHKPIAYRYGQNKKERPVTF